MRLLGLPLFLFLLSPGVPVEGKPLEKRIIGGHEAGADEVGFAVLVQLESGLCTGSLIALDWVLSAAHCFPTEGYTKSVKFTAGSPVIGSSDVQVRHSHWVKKHPDYWEGSVSKHDIAIAQVDKPFEVSSTLKVLPLSGKTWPQSAMYKVPCTAYGWGVHSKSGRPATHLQVLNVTAGHGEEACPCSKRYQEKRLVCLKPVKGQGICVGDSGSALVCGGEGVGVAHMIIDRRGCSFTKVPDLKCGARDTIGVYMFLCPYLDWISGYVRGVPGTPQSCRGSRTDRPSDHVLLFLYCLLFFANIYIY